MEISQQEAVDVLRLWKDERRIIQVHLFDLPDAKQVSCNTLGRVELVTAESVTINSRSMNALLGQSAQKFSSFDLRLSGADFMLVDWRNAPAEQQAMKRILQRVYDAVLVVTPGKGMRCELYAAKLAGELDNFFRR